MANICLIQPPIEDFYATNIRNIPLGLLHIGAMLKNHDLRLLDLRQGKSRKISFPRELQAAAKYYRPDDASPFSLYKSYSRFGSNINRIADLIPAETDVFLIAALFTTYIHEVLEIIPLIRQKNHRATIIIGGPGTYFNPDSLFDAGADFVVLGEGELAVSQLLDELEETKPNLAAVPNLVWRSDGDIKKNPVEIITNINELPFADYDIPDTPEYTLT
ncbi:MAG: cobalamin-dependent protein, partial [Candidatus Marinimicrobia bacterium]|nr:cobalamin-dependent protein [Candidatus Neomarinimicrobiota bacterium]